MSKALNKFVLMAIFTLAATPAGAADAASSSKITDRYVHSWSALPEITGKSVVSGQTINFKPERGYVNVVVFISADCLVCQRLMDRIRKLEDEFEPLSTRFLYVFSQDQEADARGYAVEFKMHSNGVVASKYENRQILTDYHNPPLPSVYISDRHRWLSKRYLGLNEKDMPELRRTLQLLTAY